MHVKLDDAMTLLIYLTNHLFLIMNQFFMSRFIIIDMCIIIFTENSYTMASCQVKVTSQMFKYTRLLI